MAPTTNCFEPAQFHVSIENLLFMAMNSQLICHIINTIGTALPWALLVFFSPNENRFSRPIRTLNSRCTYTETSKHPHTHTFMREHTHTHTFIHTMVRSSHNFEIRNIIRNIINVLCVAFGTVLRTFFSHKHNTLHTFFFLLSLSTNSTLEIVF